MTDKKIDYEKICEEIEELEQTLMLNIDRTIPVTQLSDYDQATISCIYAMDEVLHRNGYYERYCK